MVEEWIDAGTGGGGVWLGEDGSERAERVRKQRIWPFKSPIYRAFGGEFGDIRAIFRPRVSLFVRVRAHLQPRLLVTEGGCRAGLPSLSRIRFSSSLCRQRGWGTLGDGGGGGQQRIFFFPQLGRTRGRTCQIRWSSRSEVGLALTVCIIRGRGGVRSSRGARAVLGSYWLLLGPSLPPLHVTTLLPRAPRQGLFADPERCSLGFTWENIPRFVHKGCQCLRACVRACVLGGEGTGGGGRAVLSIKMPALCFHTVEQRAGPVEDDTARAQARSARTASSDQYGLMPFLVRLERCCEPSAEPVQPSMIFP